jgi:hypothetical protein
VLRRALLGRNRFFSGADPGGPGAPAGSKAEAAASGGDEEPAPDAGTVQLSRAEHEEMLKNVGRDHRAPARAAPCVGRPLHWPPPSTTWRAP